MAKNKGGLGKGLGALIPAAQIPSTSANRALEVPIDRIHPNPNQPRTRFDQTRLEELADSIRAHGLLQPILVSSIRGPEDETTGYSIIAGERRWQAARLAGLERVPILVREATPQEHLELALVENLQRADLNPLEEAAAYNHLVNEFGMTQDAVAQRVGKNPATISNSLRLLGAPTAVKQALSDGSVTEGHARALLGLRDAQLQETALRHVLKRSMSVRQTEQYVRRLLGLASALASTPTPADPDHLELEARFRKALGTKVQLLRNRRGGRIVVHFYSEDQLQGLVEMIEDKALR